MHGESINATFLVKFHKLILVLMELESRLVVLLYCAYPDRASMTTSQPFVNYTSMLSSLLRARLYTNKIWVKEGIPTIIKVFIGHDLPAAAFNLIKFARATENIDSAVSVCVIQSSKVVRAGYLLGSRKTMVDNHCW